MENKVKAEFNKNIKDLNYPEIDEDNHLLYNLFPNDNQSRILKLFKSAILFENEIDDHLSMLFGEYELKFMKLFNKIWNTTETDESELINKMIDKFIEIESNLFSINKSDIETRERSDILSSIFNAIGKIELFDICEKQYKQRKKDFPKESLVTHLNIKYNITKLKLKKEM